MSARAESQPSSLDTVKLVLAGAIFIAGVIGFYYFEAESTLYRVLGLLAVAAVAITVAMTTTPGRNSWAFAREARQELRKVIWPTKQESMQTTVIVLIMVFLVGIILWLFDMFFVWGIESLVRPGG